MKQVKKGRAAANLFSGTLHFVALSFPGSLAVPSADLQTAIEYLSKSAPLISRYCSAYGQNSLSISNNILPFSSNATKYNDKTLESWVDSIAQGNSIPSSDCLVFLNPQGAINTDADASQGVLGYHSMSPSGFAYCFVNVMGSGFTLDDRADVYAVALSHEVAEMTVDPKGNLSEPECCDECLPGDELILGDNKQISMYAPSDRVVGSTGIQEVTRKFHHEFDGDLVSIKALGMLPFRVTPNHPLLVVPALNKNLSLNYGEATWKSAFQVTAKKRGFAGDYLVMPRLGGTIAPERVSLAPYVESHRRSLKQEGPGAQPNIYPHRDSFPINIETAWLLGLYVAEGWSDPRNRKLGLALNADETELIQKATSIFEALGFKVWSDKPNGKSIKIHAGSVILARFFKDVCGVGATNKQIPDFILYHEDENVLQAFLEGYVSGDGSKRKTQHGYETTRFTTVSRILALQLQLAYGRLGVFVALSEGRSERVEKIQGRVVNCHQQYEGAWCSDMRAKRNKRFHDDWYLLPVKSVSRERYTGIVHNVETEDHTYLVSNAVVHNCAGNCGVDFRNFFDSNSNWISKSSSFPPSFPYAFFIEGIVLPANAKDCPAPEKACNYAPP